MSKLLLVQLCPDPGPQTPETAQDQNLIPARTLSVRGAPISPTKPDGAKFG